MIEKNKISELIKRREERKVNGVKCVRSAPGEKLSSTYANYAKEILRKISNRGVQSNKTSIYQK